MASRRERGAALLISVLVVLVVTVLAVGAIRYASREVAGATSTRKEAALVACADAARTMLMSRWKLLGQTSGESLEPLNDELEDVTPTTLLGGHYGEVDVKDVQIVRINDLSTGPSQPVGSLENKIGEGISNYRVTVHCTQGKFPNARELEVEFGVNYGL